VKSRNPLAVLVLSFITFGIYSLYWQVSTKGEMNRLGAKIPTAWLIVIPFVNIYWLWKYSEGVEQITDSKTTAPVAFILETVLNVLGMVILQIEFNKVGGAAIELPVASTDVATTTPSTTNPVGGQNQFTTFNPTTESTFTPSAPVEDIPSIPTTAISSDDDQSTTETSNL